MSHIEVNTTTTMATIRWENQDAASASYVYSVLVLKTGDGSNVTSEVTGIPSVTVTALIPGVSYTVKILTQVGNDTVSLVPGWQRFCMGE